MNINNLQEDEKKILDDFMQQLIEIIVMAA
jgi:hypothetical protein